MGDSESLSEYFARVNIILMKLERYNITTSAREIKRVVMNSLAPRFPNETSMLAMKGNFDLVELEHGLVRVEKLRAESSRCAPSHALAVAHAGSGQTGTGGGTRGRGKKGRRSGGRHDDGGGRHQQGHPQQMHQQQHQQHQPPAAMSQQSYAWQQHQQQQYQPPFSQGPHHQQPNPWSSWGRPPHQQQRGRAHYQRTPRHRGGHQAHQHRVMCQQCGKEEHFPADCGITMPAQTPQYLAPCSGCSMAKGIRASTPHRTTSRAEAPFDLVHIDTAGPFPESLGASRYVVMFVDSASRFQRPYRTWDKSASAILGVVQRFVADMGVPRAFRTDNGTEYTNSAFVEYCNGLQIRRELTAPYTPQQNGLVKSGLSRAIKAGHAACIEVNRLFPDVHLEQLEGVRDPDGTSLWMESVLWASKGFNRSATTANGGMLSPNEIFYGSRPPMLTLPFCKLAYHRIPRHGKLERQARLCYFLNFG